MPKTAGAPKGHETTRKRAGWVISLKNDSLAAMLLGPRESSRLRKEDAGYKELLACSYYRLGIDALKSGDSDRALVFFRKVLIFSPRFQECYINIADLLCVEGDLAGAVYYLKKSIRIKPSAEGFVFLGNIMVERTRPDKAVSYFYKALKLDPDIPGAYCGLGNALTIKGKYYKALDNYNKAKSLEGEEAGTGISNVYQNLVPNWHFAMMNDVTRNAAYEKAILKNINSSTVVLDIGSGGGLLSLMAARAGARRVYTCEQNEVLAGKAKEIVRRNGFSKNIVFLTRRSQSIKLKKDIPRKADVLVTEIFDAGLIGENALYAIKHARENLLQEGGKIVPMGASVFGALVESQELVDKYRVDHVSGFNFDCFNDFSITGYAQESATDYQINYLSNVFEVFSFDFYNITIESVIKQIPVQIIRKGRVHAVLFWFKLFLTEKICLDTGPRGKTHWKQAVQFTAPARSVREGDAVLVNAHNNNSSSISFTLDPSKSP